MTRELREGIYDLEGNFVEYEGGDYAYDVDADEEVSVYVLEVLGTFVRTFEEQYDMVEFENVHGDYDEE